MTSYLETKLDAVVFDCDGTLTSIEGIDYLAALKGVEDKIAPLTHEAMTYGTLSQALYDRRLQIVRPGRQEFEKLAQAYFAHRTPDAVKLVHVLNQLNKFVYIVSAGMTEAVVPFAKNLGVKPERVSSVAVEFDAQGNYRDFDRNSPLIENSGKYIITSKITAQHQNVAHIGDGENDFSTHDLVQRFIGYGGVFYRASLEKKCQYYVTEASMLALMPYLLTEEEFIEASSFY